MSPPTGDRTGARPRARGSQRRVTDEQHREVLEQHAAGASRNAIARAVGLSGDTVSRLVREAGETFDRRLTAAATHAKTVDQRATRIRQAGELLDDLEWVRTRLREQPDARGLADVGKALSAVVSSYARLVGLDNDQGVEDAREQLGAFGRAVAAASAELRDTEDTSPGAVAPADREESS